MTTQRLLSRFITVYCLDGDTNCSDTVTVLITINPVPDCPIVEDDVYYVT